MKFQCATCNISEDAVPMMKHLSSTRHKKIIDAASGDDIECEECGDSNVHQLQIIRFGGEDMTLICNSCYNSQYSNVEKPSTSYTLSNGSFLSHYGNYLLVSSCCCKKCGSERKLNVNLQKQVLCDECLKKVDRNQGYISEDTGRFLYYYLGIKEPSSKIDSRKKKGGRKVGRGKGKRREKKSREKKPLTVHQQMAKRAYEIKKQNNVIDTGNEMSLRSFKGSRASNVSGVNITSSKSSATPQRGNLKPQRGNSKPQRASSKPQRGNSKPQRENAKPQRESSSKPERGTSSKPQREMGSNPARLNPKSAPPNAKPARSDAKPARPNAKPARSNTPPARSNTQPARSKAQPQPSNGSKSKPPPKPKTTTPKTTFSKTKSPGGSVFTFRENAAATATYEEGIPIIPEKSHQQTLTYPDLPTYLRAYSHALFLEQQLENNFLTDFQITWPRKPTDTAFLVTIKQHNNPQLQPLLSPTLAKLGRLPFANRQTLILTSSTNQQTHKWYTFVKEVAAQRGQIKLLLELFPWNNLPLPTTAKSPSFQLLPCSAQTNRIMFAMTRIKNQKFIDLILGKNPIKRINFTNRLTLNRDTFNESQQNAIQHVLNNSITVLQGPPGTGKTTTIEEIILQLIANFHSFPILCVAASNIAIDNIAAKFMTHHPHLRALRILSEGKESQYATGLNPLAPICLHNIVNDQLPPETRDNLLKLRAGRLQDVSKTQLAKLHALQNDISDRYVSQAQILFTTNIAAGGRQLKCVQELPVVIMDEATQSSEAATLVPLSLPGIRKFVFVGDDKQLSSFSDVPQLQMSLFERVLLNGSYGAPHMLNTQYRMHPAISAFPRSQFYDGLLLDGVAASSRCWLDADGRPLRFPLFFYQFDRGRETRVAHRAPASRGFTYQNRHEAREIVRVVTHLVLDKGVPPADIGVITPYSAQRDLISDLLQRDPVVNPHGLALTQEFDDADLLNGHTSVTSSTTLNIVNGLVTATIDSFQGHEKKFVVYSCVRNNAERKIGFVADRRRLNVALTRAQYGLVLIGDCHTLDADPLWHRFIGHLQENGLVHDDFAMYR